MVIGLVGVIAASSGCKLLRKDTEEGDSSAPVAANDPFLGNDDPTFDNATEAIIASRPTAATVAAARLEESFQSGDYAASLAQARGLKDSAAPGSADLDAAVFIEGASLYYLGKHSEAQAPLDRHRAEFSESRYKESSMYYVGSNRIKQARWRAGASALDAFMNAYPESQLMEYALYDRAAAHYALGELDECYVLAAKLENDFIYSKIKDRGAILRGEVLKKKGEFADSEAAFLAAKNTADSLGHPRIAARALSNLIAVSASQKRWKDSVDYYETFFAKYPNSSQAPAAALAGLPALKEMNKLDAGLDRMETVLMGMPETTSAKSLKGALATYGKAYREAHGPENLLRRYGNLSSSGRGSKTLREQLIIARLEVLETYFPDRSAEIAVFYDEIRSRFNRSELATPTLLKIAKHIAKTDSAEAILWYREAISRRESQYQDVATLGLAQAQATSSDAGQMAEADAGFRRVLESFGSPDLEEEAVLGVARLATRRGDWKDARDYWMRYENNPNWTLARDEAKRELKEALERAGPVTEPTTIIASSVGTTSAIPSKDTPKEAGSRPVASAGSSSATAAKLELKLKQAERMSGKGMKKQAFEMLKSVLDASGDSADADKATKSALHRAKILKENLGLELGLD